MPIVFAQVDRSGRRGFVAAWRSRAATLTGLHHFEFAIERKWLELLKQICARRDAGRGRFEPAQPPSSTSSCGQSRPRRRHSR